MKCIYFNGILFFIHCFCLILTSDVNAMSNTEKTDENIEPCSNRNYIIISTVDGVITALDMKSGKKCWSTLLDNEKFLSSTLSELEIYENGRRIWLVPSFDGSLFKYDNSKIMPLPVNVDILLTHSAVFDASTSVYGGKMKIIFGIDRSTGEILYTCKVEGCEHLKSNLPENILVIEEIIQVVNAIDSSQAENKWHFRVVELKFRVTSKMSTSNASAFPRANESNALIPTSYKEFINFDTYKISLQNGFAGMMDKTSPDFLWLYKTSCPITDAWFVNDNIIEIFDPFDKESGFFSVQMEDGRHSALLFLGVYENQMFIKKSRKFPVQNMGHNALSISGFYAAYSVPVCPKTNDLITSDSSKSKDVATTEEDFNDYGSFFYMNFSIAENSTHCIINTSYIMQKDDKIKLSYWFGTVLSGIILLTFIIAFQVQIVFQEKKEYANASTSSLELQKSEKHANPETDEEFKSRFYQDFDLIAVLGKGGFGVVMDVKNKIDDCRYAVKRICLQEQLNSSQYEKVLREVKALAKLDHHGIVRYFNAWIEYPPLGWQEKKDEESKICDVSRDSFSSPCSIQDSKQKISAKKEYGKKLNQNPLQPFDDDLFNDIDDIQNNILSSKSNSNDSSLVKWQNSDSGYSKKALTNLYKDGNSLDSVSDNSFSNRNSLKQDYLKENYKKDDTSDFSISFIETNKFISPCSNAYHCDVNKKVYSNYSDSMDGIYFQIELPEKHIKCYEKLKKYNNLLIKPMDLNMLDSLRSYFFHDSLHIPITERSDWKNHISSYAFSRKNLLYFQQWLICILCLTGFYKNFKCKDARTNFCYILWDVSKMLDDPYYVQNHFSENDTNSSQKSFSKHNSHSNSTDEELSDLPKDDAEIKSIPESFKKKLSREKRSISGYLYIQMQLCKRESLHDWLNKNTNYREYDRVMEIFYEIVDAVDYVHNCGLMHRDLKPSNIYFSLEGAIKIGDFGLATSAEIQGEEIVNRKEFSCIHTCDIGTEFYMSPEQKLKQDYDSKTDIYSLGIILFELLVPFKTYSERYQVLSKVRHFKFPVEFENKFINESELVKQLLDVNPKKRPTTNEIKKHPLFLKYSSSPK